MASEEENNNTAGAADQETAVEPPTAAADETDQRVARLGDLPLEWTQMGQSDGPEAPMNVIRYPSEVTDISKDETELMVVGTAGKKITRIGPQFYKEASPDLTQLIFRSHLIRDMEGLEGFTKLEVLELYDNMVEELKNLNNGEGGVVSSASTGQATAVFSDGTVSGTGGCNRFNASYEVKGERISIGPAAATRKFCQQPEGIMDQEQQFFAALHRKLNNRPPV